MSDLRQGAAHRRDIVKAWERSGLSAAEFAPVVGRSQWTLYGWRRQIRQEGGRRDRSAPRFIELVPTGLSAGIDPVAPTRAQELATTSAAPLEVLVGDLVVRIRRENK